MKTSVVYALLLILSKGEKLVFPEGQNQSILCTVTADNRYAMNWVDNVGPVGTRFTVGKEEILEDGNKGKRVSFTATPDVNNTNLKCIVTDLLPPTNSYVTLSITIIIQGRLPRPKVEYYVKDRSALFNWKPPFSHDISNVEPDISHYAVNILRGDTLKTVNVTDTKFLLESLECQLVSYKVEIAAVNVVGMGEKYTSPIITLDEASVTDVVVDLHGQFPIANFMVDTNCLNESIVYHIKINPGNIEYTANINVTSSSHQISVSSSELKFDQFYNASSMIIGAPLFHYNTSFSTFDIQSVIIKEYSGYVHIACHFAVGSSLSDCKLVLTSHTNTSAHCNMVLTASRNTGSPIAVVVVGLPNGKYRMDNYDSSEPVHSEMFVVSFSKLDECESSFNTTGLRDNADECDSLITTLLAAMVVLPLMTAITCIAIHIMCCKNQTKDWNMHYLRPEHLSFFTSNWKSLYKKLL